MSSNVEEALTRTGWGLYSKFLFGFAAACCFSNALVFMNTPLYLPLISCDIDMNETSVHTLEICFSSGLALGGFFFTSVSDVVGRKCVITTSLTLIFLGTLFGAFSYNTVNVCISQISISSGLAANLNVVKLLIAESFPARRRNICIILLDLFWIFGTLGALGVYILCTPFILKFRTDTTRLFTWRLAQTLTGCISIILACVASLLLESPRYLIFEKRPKEALDVLREMFAVNKIKMFNNYPISESDLQGKIVDFGISNERDIPNTMSSRRCKIIFHRIHKSMLILVRKRYFVLTFITICLNILTSLGVYQMIMLLTRTLSINEDVPVNRYQIQYFIYPVFRNCSDYYEDFQVYQDFCFVSSASVLGILTLAALIFYVENKYLMVSTLVLSSVFSLMLAFVYRHFYLRFGLSILLLTFFTMAKSCLQLTIISSYPTAIRGTALGETAILARLVNMFLKHYLSISSFWIYIGIATSTACGAILSFAMPKLKNRPMTD